MSSDSASYRLPPSFLPELENEPVHDYRLSYRRFRSGHHEGSKGEVAAPLHRSPELDHEDDIETMVESDGRFQQIHAAINAYRMHYRMYRRGHPEGAKGEITDLSVKMSSRVAASLPVAQLQRLARHKREGALAPNASKYHVHLGAGRLGLGLVIPALSRGAAPFAILQRPSGAWKALTASGADATRIRVNGDETVIEFALLVNGSRPEAALGGALPVFAVTDDPVILAALIARATSYSTSLGPGLADTVLPLLGGLPADAAAEQRPALYACENDHAAVHSLAQELEGRVDVVDCMVDRICTERTISAEFVGIGTEPHPGEVVVITPPKTAPLPPLGGDNIRWPKIAAEAEYWCQRKLLMVNGMHTCLAFMTLCKHEPGGLSGDGWKEHTLNTMATADEAERRRMWVWAVARCLFIAWEHEPEVIASAHGAEGHAEVCAALLSYARATLGRFSTVQDKVGRVLGGGVANRWNGRLKVIADFLAGEPAFRGGLRGELLKQAGVGEEELRREVNALVAESQRFVGVQVQRRQSQIVVT
ncbi:mannitol 1-phosphate dehydrogenase [Tribonema minus]|uniref:Mannitol 1-phosphate dehydrogenase n=1 Tax=Tribonema minus TaxID=303371 RepID=A0A835YRM5_9STRA|nr:mannitol 1-phosphate dehydrogenase [Tribonema minus]